MIRKSGNRLPDADIELAFQLAILRHCNKYGAKFATSSLPVNRFKSPEHEMRATWCYTLGSQGQLTSNCLISLPKSR
jgi:hypothetical protein